MDIEQACLLLCVELGSDAKAIRRAYLRAVKKHRPEKDPEGFKEVREAYDLLASTPFSFAKSVRSAPVPESGLVHESDSAGEPVLSSEGVLVSGFEPGDTPPVELDVGAFTVEQQAQQDRWDRLAELEGELANASSEERIRALRAALERDPECLDLRQWLIDEYVSSGDVESLVRESRAGVVRGDDLGLLEVADFAPDRIDTRGLERLADHSPRLAAKILVARGAVDRALEVLERDRASLFRSGPSGWLITGQLDVLLELLREDYVGEAEELLGDLKNSIAELGLGMGFDDFTKLRLVLTSELTAAWLSLPSEAEMPLLALVRAPDLPDSIEGLANLRLTHPRVARATVVALRAKAPSLAKLAADVLGPAREKAGAPRTSRRGLWLMLATFALLTILRLLGRQACSGPSRRDLLVELPIRALGLSQVEPLDDIAVRIEGACHTSWRGCETARELVRLIDNGECESARSNMAQLRFVDHAPTLSRTELEIALGQRMEISCGVSP